jgi:hypothetical protein
MFSMRQVVATAPGRSPTAHQLEVDVQVRPGYSARSKKEPHESRTLQFTILRGLLSFAIVVKTRNQMVFKIITKKSRHKLTRTRSLDIFWVRSPLPNMRLRISDGMHDTKSTPVADH